MQAGLVEECVNINKMNGDRELLPLIMQEIFKEKKIMGGWLY